MLPSLFIYEMIEKYDMNRPEHQSHFHSGCSILLQSVNKEYVQVFSLIS